jgi:hypothetical protein
MPEPNPAAAPEGLVPIAFVYSQPEASVLVATLRAYGLHAFAFDQDTLYVAPWLMTALGGIRVVVPEKQKEDAVALLADIDAGWSCPPRAFADERWVSWATSVITFFLILVAPPPRVRGDYGWRGAQSGSDSGPR